jgi:hypothetical protein
VADERPLHMRHFEELLGPSSKACTNGPAWRPFVCEEKSPAIEA